MPRIDVGTSIDEIKDEGPKPIDPGKYGVKIEVAELRDNKAKDGKLLYMEYSVQEPEDLKGHKLFDRISLKETSLWRLKRFLTAAEVPYECASFDTEDVLGATLEVQVRTSEYQGRLGNEIADYVVPAEVGA